MIVSISYHGFFSAMKGHQSEQSGLMFLSFSNCWCFWEVLWQRWEKMVQHSTKKHTLQPWFWWIRLESCCNLAGPRKHAKNEVEVTTAGCIRCHTGIPSARSASLLLQMANHYFFFLSKTIVLRKSLTSEACQVLLRCDKDLLWTHSPGLPEAFPHSRPVANPKAQQGSFSYASALLQQVTGLFRSPSLEKGKLWLRWFWSQVGVHCVCLEGMNPPISREAKVKNASKCHVVMISGAKHDLILCSPIMTSFLSAIFKSRNRKLGMAPQITRGARGIYQRSNSDSNKSWISAQEPFFIQCWLSDSSMFQGFLKAKLWLEQAVDHNAGTKWGRYLYFILYRFNLEWIFRSLEARNKQLQPHIFLDRCKTWPNRLRLWVKYGVCFLEPAQTLRPLELLKHKGTPWECRNLFRTVVENIQGLVGSIKATRETECNGAEKSVWFPCFQHEVLLPPRSPMTPWKKFVYTCNETNRWVLFNQFSHVASNTCNNAKIRKHTTLALHCENWLFQGKVRQRQICSNNPAIKVALQWNPGDALIRWTT